MKNGKAANARLIGPMTEAVASELRAELGRQKRSAKSLAESAGLTRSTLHKTLNAQRAIDVDDLFHLADLLNVSPSELFERAEVQARRHLDDGLFLAERLGVTQEELDAAQEENNAYLKPDESLEDLIETVTPTPVIDFPQHERKWAAHGPDVGGEIDPDTV
ncbi:helix-turn-helix domain-containing protein [Pseudoclavibacter sp. 8L]|uniref:helix-turn-helix domain-containing protein n=1 Tax=Pseudoclavibacter sp. 8L TaxID=2653162 RepID=UPI0012EEEA64|nr:helix-turn-helix transcriptional regulator [Pseudoclavibacter sp. 8L]VXB76593.1 hypothetical protein PSCLAVI8L_180184 [Pseudoclavibacter sp. 8L]